MAQTRRNYAMGRPIRIGDWRVDPALDLLQRGDEIVKLEPRKMRLLMALAARPGELVLADELIDTVWKDVIVTPNSLYQSIAQLRRQLGDDAEDPRYIVTVPRKGYRLVAPVTEADDEPTKSGAAAAASPESPPRRGKVEPVSHATPAETPKSDETSTRVLDAAHVPEPAGGSTVSPRSPAASTSTPPRSIARRAALIGGALAAAAGAGLLWRRQLAGGEAPPLRLAVVAFRDESAPVDDPGLADALADEVIRQLGADSRLRVVARDSSHTFRAGALGSYEVARQLGITLLLEGTVQRSSGSVRVQLVLIDAAAGRVRWRDSLTLPAAELPRLPRLLSERTLGALGLTTAPPLDPEPPLAAFEAYVHGLQAARMRTPESLLTARAHYERAVAIEPAYAQAYAALAAAWLAEIDYGSAVDYDTALARAQEAIDRALDAAPGSAEALSVQGLLHIKRHEYDRAREPLRQAIAARPSYAAAHFWLGVTYAFQGRPREAMPHYSVAAELNPLDFQVHTRLGTETLYAGFAERALRHFGRARELAPHHPNPLWGQALVGYARGRLDDAVLGYLAALALEPRRSDLWLEMGWTALDLGLAALAARALAASVAHGGSPADPRAVGLRDGVASVAPGAASAAPTRPSSLGEWLGEAVAAAGRADAAGARDALEAITRLWPREHLAVQGAYEVFHDRLPSLDVAAVALWLRHRDADQWLALGRSELDRLEQQGFVCHSLLHQRARLLALTDAPEAALQRLHAAVAAGWRRFWRLRLDPAMKQVADRAELAALAATMQPESERQRARVARELTG